MCDNLDKEIQGNYRCFLRKSTDPLQDVPKHMAKHKFRTTLFITESDSSGGNPENLAPSGATLMQRKLAIGWFGSPNLSHDRRSYFRLKLDNSLNVTTHLVRLRLNVYEQGKNWNQSRSISLPIKCLYARKRDCSVQTTVFSLTARPDSKKDDGSIEWELKDQEPMAIGFYEREEQFCWARFFCGFHPASDKESGFNDRNAAMTSFSTKFRIFLGIAKHILKIWHLTIRATPTHTSEQVCGQTVAASLEQVHARAGGWLLEDTLDRFALAVLVDGMDEILDENGRIDDFSVQKYLQIETPLLSLVRPTNKDVKRQFLQSYQTRSPRNQSSADLCADTI
ncbi:hypothetical protein WN51_10256 [Melipona quadrifasciata]|uniref:Uncharacterized protein n=1 Tax=Melipona quadrifasciata TaxID=166423 RepID=A0A0M9A5Z8_9HYME|nr:hypothetical protein WN51_10256 [Melipona quadrifasciata]